LRDMGSLVCAYQSMQLVCLARSELGNQVTDCFWLDR